jgi:SAM-dependent methyltransferase
LWKREKIQEMLHVKTDHRRPASAGQVSVSLSNRRFHNRLRTLVTLTRQINRWELGSAISYCPLCDRRSVMIKLNANEMAVRCTSCRASAATMSLVSVLRNAVTDFGSKVVYEMSSRGPYFRFLKRNAGQLVTSEYFPDVAPGEYRGDVQCQDVQRLSYPDASFDICTSSEVFEHVPDDSKGFSEILRVLKPNGFFALTVPLRSAHDTLERALIDPDGKIQHLVNPEYHVDPLRRSGILAFRTYGRDITDRLRRSGFSRADIVAPRDRIPWGYSRFVVLAYR